MNHEQFKAWRAAQRLSQTELADRLGISRESITKYERAVNPVPKAVELACAALSLGIEDFEGKPISLDRFKLVAKFGVEWIETLEWRSEPQPEGTIQEWLKEHEIGLQPNETLTTSRASVSMMITMRWR